MEKNTTGKNVAYPVLKAWLFYTLAVIMVMYFCVGYYGGIWLGALGIGLVGIIITSIFLLRNHQNPGAVLLVFSGKKYEEALADSWRYDKDLWVDWECACSRFGCEAGDEH